MMLCIEFVYNSLSVNVLTSIVCIQAVENWKQLHYFTTYKFLSQWVFFVTFANNQWKAGEAFVG